MEKMSKPLLPKNVEQIGESKHFSFACHKRISCFTDCCRQLDLALTPYDVLRLKNGLGISSTEFLNRYVIIEEDDNDAFPHLYLTMVDDGRASCVFVSKEGCSVYQDRPGPCRAYPMGRASKRGKDNQLEQFFVLLHEDHCKGFDEKALQSPLQYSRDQGLDSYNTFNDALIPILQHDKIRQGMVLTKEQRDYFTLALYDLDNFRKNLFSCKLTDTIISTEEKNALVEDTDLLLFAVEWLREKLFENS